MVMCGWYVAVLVYKQCMKVKKMTEMENFGIQSGKMENKYVTGI